ncbi:hypothetical protein KIH74_17585 [Kineosporia sp. J2-2]|uniref:N-acetyltransferase domain-containing protein n=1 Tax=Kineosporia corallincola TaxID=2835133 RepID=A0ABS5TK44_9ACTN|nr:hypothetical protein [Kineosporia corallincola]MBT0770759.1 hypothetical protein [Kineosporia corallincola]
MSAAELSFWDGPATMEHFADVRAMFHAAFPRDSLADHRDALTRQAASPGFATVAASAGGEMVGCVWGVPLQLGTPWWQDLEPRPDDDFTLEDGRRTFAVLELCVARGHDGELGARLLHALLGRRRETRATTKSSAVSGVRALAWQVSGRTPTRTGDVEVRVLGLPYS